MFLVFPLNGRPDWRRPPIVTILLIVINCIVYFGFQLHDESVAKRAAVIYAESDLPRIEIPYFVKYLKSTDQEELAAYVAHLATAKRYATVLLFIEDEGEFDRRLKSGDVIARTDVDYATWRDQRNAYDAARGRPFTQQWGSDPAAWRPITAITAVFMHASFWHLFGNMVFLFAFGYTVELTLGPWLYLAFYLVCGFGGEIGDLIARWGSHGIGLGASGAISGLMAMYVVLYGLKRIRFFYQLLFYFDYVTAPAIILLPAWVATEFLQQWFDTSSHVAHMAHAGGFVTGALLAWLYKRRYPDAAVPEAPKFANTIDAERARASDLLRALRTDEARAAFGALALKMPQDNALLSQYFNLARLVPASEDFHRASAMIFALKGADPATDRLVHETFTSYLANAKPSVRLSPDQLARLSRCFARRDHADDAVRLVRLLATRDPDHREIAGILLAVIEASHRAGDRASAASLMRDLHKLRPESPEARVAAALAADSGTGLRKTAQ